VRRFSEVLDNDSVGEVTAVQARALAAALIEAAEHLEGLW